MTQQNEPFRVLENYQRLRLKAEEKASAAAASGEPVITVAMATCGIASGAIDTYNAIKEILQELDIQVRLRTVGCTGHCYAEPVVIIDHPSSGFPPLMYHGVSAGKARMIVKSFLRDGDPLFEHVLGATTQSEDFPTVMDFPRFNREKRVIMETCGVVDPDDIFEYIEHNGYAALAQTLETPRSQIIETMRASGLRGRGGAGFETGRKWDLASKAPGDKKYVICNADEGDPGAYMDRTVLESSPHQVIEGIAICAYAVGAAEAIMYIRAEYPLAVSTVERALKQAEKNNLIGANVLGSDFSIHIRVFKGSGAFVCGEETALIASIQGERGTPRYRPPYPASHGLNGAPTVINNVKTLASVPPIISRGAEWYRGIGSAGSPGTAVFSVVGDVVHPGLVEIPTGISLRSLIFEVCGGIPHKKKFKAVQIGGPSGGCLSETFLDVPVDFDSLREAGAMMGSGGIVVMDEDSCMVDVARYFLEFTRNESCGKCTFCRIGTAQLLEILNRITIGEGKEGDLETLEELCEDIAAGSLCALGKTAPNPVLTSLHYFRDEYEAHVVEGRCPACVCRALTAYYIDLDRCARGCDACVGCCPVEAIFTTANRKKGVDQTLCVKCGECAVACPPEYDAVRKVSPPSLAPIIPKPVTE
jgi:NADH-quinone oxidoreductase subunit F